MNTKIVIFVFFLFSLKHITKPNTATPISANSSNTNPNTETTDFIRNECKSTHYPSLCFQCLANYSTTINQNPQNLAQAALSVSLSRAQSTASFISKLPPRLRGMKPVVYQAVKDCTDNIGVSVVQLNRSVKELSGVSTNNQQGFDWHVSNVKTWVSTALTGEQTCLYGISGTEMDAKVKASIKRKVLDCAMITSNALGLVNRFAATRRHSSNTSP